MSHVIMLVGRLVMTIPEDGKVTLRLGGRELRHLGLGKDRRQNGREVGLRDRIQNKLLLQRTEAALAMHATTPQARVLCNLDQNRTKIHHQHAHA